MKVQKCCGGRTHRATAVLYRAHLVSARSGPIVRQEQEILVPLKGNRFSGLQSFALRTSIRQNGRKERKRAEHFLGRKGLQGNVALKSYACGEEVFPTDQGVRSW